MSIKQRDNIICLVICMAGVLASLCIIYTRSTVPYWRCSEVYKHYSKVEGIRAMFVKDFRVNDTLTVDVTLLEATDSAGWEYMLQQFDIPPDVRRVYLQYNMNLFDWQSPRGHPEIRAVINGEGQDAPLSEEDIESCLLSFRDRKICVFHTKNAKEIAALHEYNCNNMINKTNIILTH